MVKRLKNFKNRIRVFIKLGLAILIIPSLLYAQNDSIEQENNQDPNSKGVVRKLLKVNKEASQQLDKAADIIDKKLSPRAKGEFEVNKTHMYFVIGGDFDDRGNAEPNFRYGLQLHLPRFEHYWKVKFANQDEKRERGQSSMTRERRTRTTDDDIFLGVSFSRNWNKVNIDYKPQLAFHRSLGLDHSIEASSEYQRGRFTIKPSLEIFGNHKEGLGNSGVLRFGFRLLDNVSLFQNNDARFLHEVDALNMNHVIGIGYNPNDRLGVSFNYFRGFENPGHAGFALSAYGYYIGSQYVIYRNVLTLELQPYVVYERAYDFEKTYGALANFRVQF